MRLPAAILAGIALAGLAGNASANDSSAALGAGGIELTQSADIAMVSEDLFVSIDEVRVRYEFRNNSAADIETLVAFPLPEIRFPEHYETPVEHPTDQVENFIGFRVFADGVEIQPRYEARATVDGRDVTATLEKAGIPLTMFDPGLYDRLEGQPAAVKRALNDAGIVDWVGEYNVEPLWTTNATYYWTQRFPAGRTIVVEHRYKPVVGYGFFGSYDIDEVATDAYWRQFCIDQPTLNAISRRIEEQKQDYAYLLRRDIDYVLTTANNWAGPIGTFHLVIDKGDPSALVSFCGQGVTKTSPTRFEVTYHNYSPTEELHVLILETPTPDRY